MTPSLKNFSVSLLFCSLALLLLPINAYASTTPPKQSSISKKVPKQKYCKNKSESKPETIVTRNGKRVDPQLYSLERMKKFVAEGGDVNALDSAGWTPIYFASIGDRADVVRFLIDHGAKINLKSEPWSLLTWAMSCGSVKVAKLLIEKGADINIKTDFGTPLHAAAGSGSGELVEFLLSHGAEVNAKDKFGDTPLHAAMSNDSVEVVGSLIKYGAKIGARDFRGDTPLHLAAAWGSQKVAKLLLKYKACINAKNKQDETPLHYAAGHDTWATVTKDPEGIVKVLLAANGADVNVNARDKSGNTPLHYAAKRIKEHPKVAQILLEYGADVEAKNKNGETALDIAKKCGYCLRCGKKLARKNRE